MRQKFLKVMTVQFGAAESRQTSGEFETLERTGSNGHAVENGGSCVSLEQASSSQAAGQK